MPPSSINGKRLVAGVVVSSMVGGFAGWLWGEAPQPAAMAERPAEQWQIPSTDKPDLKPALQFLAGTAIWGKVTVAPVVEELGDPKWRIVGLLQGGKEKFVIISIEKQPVKQLTIGDELPGGAKILDIKDEALCVLVNGKRRSLPIARQGALIL